MIQKTKPFRDIFYFNNLNYRGILTAFYRLHHAYKLLDFKDVFLFIFCKASDIPNNVSSHIIKTPIKILSQAINIARP